MKPPIIEQLPAGSILNLRLWPSRPIQQGNIKRRKIKTQIQTQNTKKILYYLKLNSYVLSGGK